MWINKVFSSLLLLIIVSPNIFIHVRCEQYYIVTSRESACPSELKGEPCLTLQQYISTPIYDNISTVLVMESGKHELSVVSNGQAYLAESYTDNFTMVSDNAIVHIGQYMSVQIRSVPIVHIIGTTFTGYGTLHIYDAEVIAIEECTFLGIVLSLNGYYYYPNADIILANIIRTHFSEYCDSDSSNAYRSIRRSSLILSSSNNVTVSYCTFSNSRGINIRGNINTLSILHNSFSDNSGHAINMNSYGQSLLISKCSFVNNVVGSNGGAVYIAGRITSITVNMSTFIDNRVTSKDGYGGAIYFVDPNYVTISESYFISNSGSRGGAISIVNSYLSQVYIVIITNSIFESNKALDTGGVAFISNNRVLVSNSTFTKNMATRDGGVIHADGSSLNVSNNSFKKNKAGVDGGVFFTYALPTNYSITQSVFTRNEAGDDGGAIFVGQKGSKLIINECSFRDNHAADRGGAITLFGGLLTITTTNIHGNRARIGNSINACYSNVSTVIPSETRDLTNMFCAVYDTESVDHLINEPQELSYSSTILQHSESKESCSDTTSLISVEDVLSRLHKTITIAYSALSVSIAIATAISVYAFAKMAVKCQTKVKSRRSNLQQTAFSVQNQITRRSGDSANTVMATNLVYKTSENVTVTPNSVYNNTEDIEMTPNSVYGHATITHM